MTLHLATPVSFVLGPASDLGAKYEDVASVIAHTTLHVGDVVDVSVPQAMTVTGSVASWSDRRHASRRNPGILAAGRWPP